VPSLAFGLAFTGLWWGIAKLMERRGIVIKV
jgi:predicted acyltransferase